MVLVDIQENIDLTIAVHEPKWHFSIINFEDYVNKVCLATLNHQLKHLQQYCPAIANEMAGIALVFTNSNEVQNLNKQFRGKDAPTNVLSFAADMQGVQPEGQEIILGDIIFSHQVIEAEAVEQGKSFVNHFTHMIIHGLLHLLGYDHIIEAEADIMEQIERDILHIFHISNPYLINEQEYDINQLHGT